jgi:hypothetical protein
MIHGRLRPNSGRPGINGLARPLGQLCHGLRAEYVDNSYFRGTEGGYSPKNSRIIAQGAASCPPRGHYAMLHRARH